MDVPVLCFEVEGLLIETAPARRAALATALAADGLTLDDATWEQVRPLGVEPAIIAALRRLGAPDDPTAVTIATLRAEQGFADRITRGITLAPALLATLERLAAVARLAIVSRAARREIDTLLERAGCAGLFRPILGADDLTHGLPAAWTRVIAQTQTRFPGQRLQPYVVSDALETIREGRRAGLGTILIGAIPAHEAIEADAWLESLADLTPDRVRALRASPSGDPL
jgi:beta-phosphoglucomutase-like phosphatase (HAD superfamily)